MNSPAAQKAQLRRELRAARRALSFAQRDAKARRAALHLLRSPRLRRAQRIAVYLAAGQELDTAALIAALQARRRIVLVPVVDARRERAMRMLRLAPDAPLRKRRYGIREPLRRLRSTRRTRIDLVVLPLIGFDAQGHRLGSGGGYYDRWLAVQKPRPFCLGYAFAIQQTAALPVEPHDQRLNAVCTERGVRYFNRR